jgi:hypothetical protein
MKLLDVLKRDWRLGDSIEATKVQLDEMADAGSYDSYDRTYSFGGLKWRITQTMARRDGSTIYYLTAIEKE